MKNFLLQSQRAYLTIQKNGGIPGLPEFNVLADLRTEKDVYVTAYMFNVEPRPFDWDSLNAASVYDSVCSLRKLFLNTLEILLRLCDMRIYHRTFTHQSLRLEIYQENDVSAKQTPYSVFVIGLETCKLFQDNGGMTNLPYAMAQITDRHRPDRDSLKQYNGKPWNADTTEEEYRREVCRRASCVFLNVLAPEHLKETFDGDSPAQLKEIMRTTNDIWDKLLRQCANSEADSVREELKSLVAELTDLKDGKRTGSELLREWRRTLDA